MLWQDPEFHKHGKKRFGSRFWPLCGTQLRERKLATCSFDRAPSTLLKLYVPLLSPITTQAVHLSFQTGHALNVAVIHPLPKMPTMNLKVFIIYRHISNLAFLSKVLEKHLQYSRFTLFIYILPVGRIISRHWIFFHCYACLEEKMTKINSSLLQLRPSSFAP